MDHKCQKCENIMAEKIGNYYYRESGLRNLFLENIPVYECSCGVSYPAVFRLHRLNQLIGERLIEKPALLNGEEIRFLRKSLRMSSKEFSDVLGLDKTTFSKWENNFQSHRESYDRLIRITYMALKKMATAKQTQVVTMLRKIRLAAPNAPHVLIAARVGSDYQIQWKIVAESYVGKARAVWVESNISVAYTTRLGVAVRGESTKYGIVMAQQGIVGAV